MAASHKYQPTRIGRFKDLPEGREPETASKAIVSPDDYPKLLAMSQAGYLISVIGRAFGVSGTTAGKLIRKYQAEVGL